MSKVRVTFTYFFKIFATKNLKEKKYITLDQNNFYFLLFKKEFSFLKRKRIKSEKNSQKISKVRVTSKIFFRIFGHPIRMKNSFKKLFERIFSLQHGQVKFWKKITVVAVALANFWEFFSDFLRFTFRNKTYFFWKFKNKKLVSEIFYFFS